MKKRIHIVAIGRVHGVSFRFGTKRHAKKFDLTGWVKNKDDGTVEVIAEGEETNLKQLIRWCMKGPFLARVEDLKTKWKEYKGEFEHFSIKY